VRRGFTLLELLIVIAILGITTAVVVPAFARATRDSPAARVADNLQRFLADARGIALARSLRVRVTLVPETARYWVRLASDTDVVGLDSGTVALEAGVRLLSASARPSIAFDPLGVADGDTLAVQGPSGTLVLALDRWTGEVHAEPR
jgi:prepilin-type N-terminal cleavage/methylation domain-containing protein